MLLLKISQILLAGLMFPTPARVDSPLLRIVRFKCILILVLCSPVLKVKKILLFMYRVFVLGTEVCAALLARSSSLFNDFLSA